MQTNESFIEVLNDLIKINNDRISGYQKAIEEIIASNSNNELRSMFNVMGNDSRRNVKELSQLVQKAGGIVSGDTTISGKIYRAWMDIRSAITGHDRKSILKSCEYGEDAAQKAYESALSSDVEIDAESRQMIMSQKTALKDSHDIIKKCRDLLEALV